MDICNIGLAPEHVRPVRDMFCIGNLEDEVKMSCLVTWIRLVAGITDG